MVYCSWRKKCRVTCEARTSRWLSSSIQSVTASSSPLAAERMSRPAIGSDVRALRLAALTLVTDYREESGCSGKSFTELLSCSPRRLKAMQECLSSSSQQLCLCIWASNFTHTCLCNASGIPPTPPTLNTHKKKKKITGSLIWAATSSGFICDDLIQTRTSKSADAT